MGFWSFVGDTVVGTVKVASAVVIGTTGVVGGTVLSLVPIVGPAAGGAIAAGTGNLIRQMFENDELDTDELQEAVSTGTSEGFRMGADLSYDGPQAPSVFYPPAEYMQ